MGHMTGIEVKCNEEQKQMIIDLMAESLELGKLSSKEHIKELLENQIKWDVVKIK